MKRLLIVGSFLSLSAHFLVLSNCQAQDKAIGTWVPVFNGKDLDGWKISYGGKGNEKNSTWKVVDGMIVSDGEVSHLFTPRGDYKNFEAKAELMISDKGNSGFYLRTTFGPGFPKGYEAQVNATHSDPVRTGSIYNHVKIFKQLHKPNEWFSYHFRVTDAKVDGKSATSIKVSVNNEVLYDYIDYGNTNKTGHFAFQQHNVGSVVKIKNFEVKELK